MSNEFNKLDEVQDDNVEWDDLITKEINDIQDTSSKTKYFRDFTGIHPFNV